MFGLPARLAIAITLAFISANYVGRNIVSIFYTLSVGLRDILMLILPFVVLSYLSAAILNLRGQATTLIIWVFGLVIISNAISVFVAYGTAHILLSKFLNPISLDAVTQQNGIEALYRLPFSIICEHLTADRAMLLGLIIGLGGNLTKSNSITRYIMKLKHLTTVALNFAFIPFLPIYVFGFVLKIGYEGVLSTLVTSYAPVFFLSFFTIQIYLFIWYVIGCKFNIAATLTAIRNMLPALLTGFSTMSSAATLPVTLRCVEKITKNQQLADFVVPATANIHMVGDGINITLTALALLVMSGSDLPSMATFLLYVGAYIITKFSGSGIPGGGMIILLPVVEKHLGLSSELCSLVATLYILQDPIMTASNIAGNGAFALVVNRLKSINLLN